MFIAKGQTHTMTRGEVKKGKETKGEERRRKEGENCPHIYHYSSHHSQQYICMYVNDGAQEREGEGEKNDSVQCL